MNPGLPGAGVGGLFYVISALWMPICELWRHRQGDAPGQWPLVARQFGIAVGIIAAMSAAFWALDAAFPFKEVAAHAAGQAHLMLSLRVSALLVTSCVLAGVLGAVHIVRLCLRLRTVRHAAR